MSTLSVTNLKNAASATNNLILNPDGSVNISGGTLSSQSGMRNRIINGGMTIDQRNAGAAVTNSGGVAVYAVDRFAADNATDAVYTVQQVTDAPSGFISSAKVTVTTADASIGASQTSSFLQAIEGYNLADLGWGTASAQTVTMSFWVKSSLTGTFGGALRGAASTRSYPFTYTISAANTWEQKVITIVGETTGTWNNTNGVGVQVLFGLAMGSTFSGTPGAWASASLRSATGATNILSTLGATWFITGVQLEKGSVATPFEFRSIGQELALCQRYYYKVFPNLVDVGLTGYGGGVITATTSSSMIGAFPVPMRIRPTALEQSGTAAHYALRQPGATNVTCNAVPTFSSFTSEYSFFVSGAVASGLTLNLPAILCTANAAAFLAWSVEL
jgi:hypothetical protein